MTQGPLLKNYEARVASGSLLNDPAQRKALSCLENLAASFPRSDRSLGSFSMLSFLGKKGNLIPRLPKESVIKNQGLYLQGDVGCGKTMMMDLFFEHVQEKKKKREHFHAFMRHIHRALFECRANAVEDPMSEVIVQWARTVRLLCLDEFEVTDIADAMVLGRLLRGMVEAGIVLVLTSNRLPEALYPGGLNRQAFLPAISFLRENLLIVELKTQEDYRLTFSKAQEHYLVGTPEETSVVMQALFERLTGCRHGRKRVLQVGGRPLILDETVGTVARISFDALCRHPLGRDDYLALAETFSLIFIEGIPRLSSSERNETKRLITAIDTFYDHNTHIILSAAAPPSELYTQGVYQTEFQRTASRLEEMRSRAYWERGQRQKEARTCQHSV